MDPSNVAACILSVVAALDKVRSLTSDVKQFLKASEEIEAVLRQVQSLTVVLQSLSRKARTGDEEGLCESLQDCGSIVVSIESVVKRLFVDHKVVRGTALRNQLFRLRWAQKRQHIEHLAQRLERAKTTLGLQLLVADL